MKKIKIPNMVLWKEDIQEYYKGKITKKDMEIIADKLSDAMLYDWGLVIRTIVSDYYGK